MKVFFGSPSCSRWCACAVMTLAILSSVSCRRSPSTAFTPIRYVDVLLSDSLPHVQGLASLSGLPSGSVVLIGEPERCARVGEELLGADRFDNIDGRPVPDGLPDFAGETISVILDRANAPYAGYLPGNPLFLREMAMRQVVFALDTVCRTSLYDPSSLAEKRPAKVLVICSELLVNESLADIHDFFFRTGAAVSVIDASDTAAACAVPLYNLLRDRRLFTHEIELPKAEVFMTYPVRDPGYVSRTDSTGAFLPAYKYGRAPGELAPTFSLVRLEAMPGWKLHDLYVQHQY